MLNLFEVLGLTGLRLHHQLIFANSFFCQHVKFQIFLILMNFPHTALDSLAASPAQEAIVNIRTCENISLKINFVFLIFFLDTFHPRSTRSASCQLPARGPA